MLLFYDQKSYKHLITNSFPGNRTWFQRIARTKDLQRKGKALNIDIASVNGTQYNNVPNETELKTTTKMSTPDSYGKLRKVDYTSIWIGFGAWLVIVTTAVVFVGYKVYLKCRYIENVIMANRLKVFYYNGIFTLL